MKKAFALFLALLMVVPMFGCVQADINSPAVSAEVVDTPISAGTELNTLAEASTGYSKVVASDSAFVRNGEYANQVMGTVEAGGSVDSKSYNFLELKKNAGSFGREILIKFDLTKVNFVKKNRVQIVLDFDSTGGGGKIFVYGISNNWNSQTVTFSNAPKAQGGSVGMGVLNQNGTSVIDVTDYVFEQYDNGATEVSFRICDAEEKTSQGYMFPHDTPLESRRPFLRADYCSLKSSFATDIFANKEDNDAIWAYAQEIYDEWYARYKEILAKGDNVGQKIVSNPADFSVVTPVKSGPNSSTVNNFKTRLVNTIAGYTPKTTEEDIYGGNIEAKRYEATGRYYTKKIDGRWWIIDPLGYLCYVRGINHIHHSYQNGSPYQTEQMMQVYGSVDKWAIAASRWSQNRFHINVAAARATVIETVEMGLSYILTPKNVGGYASKNKLVYKGTPMTLLYNNTMPVFNPDYEAYVDEQAKATIEKYPDKSRVFGYTSDNEIMLTSTALTQYLSLDYTDPNCYYSYAVAWTWYKNFTGEDAPKYEDVDKYSEKLGVDLQDLFQGFVYDRYFKVASTAIKKYDPDALYMGPRSLTKSAQSEWYLRTAGYWTDVYCVNYYSSWEIDAKTIENIGKWYGKPFLVTEFYAKGADAISPLGEPYPNRDGAGWFVETQTQRGEYYQNFCLRLLESKNCIGWLYFQYIDNDPHVNPDASNKGMVNCDHDTEVYEDMNKQIQLVNENVYNLIDFFDGK